MCRGKGGSKIETLELYPGVHLHYTREERFKTEYLSIDFLVGKDLYKPGAAQVLSSVLGMGCAAYPTVRETERALLDLYGASLFTRGYFVGETYVQPFSIAYQSARYLPKGEDVEKEALDLLFSFLLAPCATRGAFKKEYVDYQKKNALDRLKAAKNNKRRYAVRKCLQTLCPGELSGYPEKAYEKDIKAVGARALYAYYREILQKAPVEIFYFGRRDKESVKVLLTERMAPLFSEKNTPVKDTPSPLKDTPERKVEKIRAEQSVLCIGFKTPILPGDRRYIAYGLMRDMLCDSPVSLLFTNVRERMGLCYDCFSTALSTKGVFVVTSGIETANAKIAEEAILRELENMKRGHFDDALLENCKRSICNDIEEMKDNPAALEGRALRMLLAGTTGELDDLPDKVRAVSREDVEEAAKTLAPDSFFLLMADSRGGVYGK